MTTKEQIEAAFAEATVTENRCALGKLLDSLDPPARKALQVKIDDNLQYSGTLISKVLKGLGFPPVSKDAVNRHRKHECRCKF